MFDQLRMTVKCHGIEGRHGFAIDSEVKCDL